MVFEDVEVFVFVESSQISQVKFASSGKGKGRTIMGAKRRGSESRRRTRPDWMNGWPYDESGDLGYSFACV